MRISTPLLSQLALDSMLRQQSRLSETQLQISAGKRLLSPADDPYNASRSLNLGETVAINDQYQLNAGHAENRLVIEEGALQGVNTALQRIRELALTANNDSQTAESRKFISVEVEKLYDQLIDIANTTDANNEYLFAGFQGKTKPFVPDAAGVVQYFGDDGQRFLKIGPSTEVAVGDSGTAVFREVRNGNGTFTTLEGPANAGTGIIDPGSVVGSFVTDTYTVKFLDATVPPNKPGDPSEYYVVDGAGNVVVPPLGIPELGVGNFLDQVTLGAATGVQFEDGAAIQGLAPFGIQTYITGEPKGGGAVGVPGDTFTISPSANQDIFTTVRNLIAALDFPQNSDTDRTYYHNAMNRVVTDLDQGMGKILDTRAKIGARLNTIEKQVEVNESFNLQMKKTLSSIEDLDYAKAITDLNLQLTGLQAAQQSFAKIQGLSLFNYL